MSSAGPSHAEFSLNLPGPSLPGPSSSSGPGLRCHVATSLAIREAGNGSTNGSSDTPGRPKKRKRRPETWKKNVAKVKRIFHHQLGRKWKREKLVPHVVVSASVSISLQLKRKRVSSKIFIRLEISNFKMHICLD